MEFWEVINSLLLPKILFRFLYLEPTSVGRMITEHYFQLNSNNPMVSSQFNQFARGLSPRFFEHIPSMGIYSVKADI